MAFNYFAGLFNTSTGSNGNSLWNLYNSLGDYGSIQSGSYKKLLSAYYKVTSDTDTEEKSSSKKNPVQSMVTTTDTKAYTTTKKHADQLSDTAGELLSSSSPTLYDAGNEEQLLKKVNGFISAYNTALSDGMDSGSATVSSVAEAMKNNTKAYEKSLKEIGITLDKENKLTLDEEAFQSADRSTVKKILGSNSSYVGDSRKLAVQMSAAATNAASGVTTYNSSGTHNLINANHYFDSYL